MTEEEKDQILGNDTKGIDATGQVTIGSKTIVFQEIPTLGSEYDNGNIKIGDKLTYSANGANDWIIFGKDNMGNILITTSDSVGNYNPTFDAKHWLLWEKNLNDECEIYSGTVQGKAVIARSITLEDVNNVIGLTLPEFTKYRFGTVQDYEDEKVNYYYPSKDTTANDSICQATVDTLEVENGSEDVPARDFELSAYNYHKVNDSIQLYYRKSGTTTINATKIDNLKYVIGGEKNLAPYFLATSSVDVMNNCAAFGIATCSYGWVMNGTYNMCYLYADASYNNNSSAPSGHGLRPVIPLQANIQVELKPSGKYDIK